MAEKEKQWKPTEEELKEILEQHKKWLESFKTQGQKAELEGADLSGSSLKGVALDEANLRGANLNGASLQGVRLWNVDLRGANLEHADLREASIFWTNLEGARLLAANFEKARLIGVSVQSKNNDGYDPTTVSGAQEDALQLVWTNFQEADLPEADLHGANFNKARFEDADLTDANLSGGRRLTSQQLAGAKLNGAQLPEDIKKFDSLKQVDESSQSTKRIFLAMLLACAYSALTIFSTTDAQLLPNSASSPLPIIGTSIPIAGFFGVAPAILLAMFFYFHIYLQDLWEDLALLPAVFPDGTPLNKRVFPWLLNGLVQRYLPRLKDYRTAMYPLRVVVSSLLAWWTVPLTIALFWIRYLPRHDWLVTGFHMGFFVVSIVFAAWSQGLAKRTVRGHVTRPKTSWQKRWGLAGLSLASLLLVLVVSDGALQLQWTRLNETGLVKSYRTFVPWALTYIVASANADVSEKEVSTKPQNWFLIESEERIDSTRGAQLRGLNLRNIAGREAFLVKADLRGANLQKANLGEANLQGANLEGANLQAANLEGANLQGAILVGVNLQKADLRDADLRKANLLGAHLHEAKLLGANLQEANLAAAKLKKAIVGGAHLQEANLGEAQMQNANLSTAHLEKANLRDADLRKANLLGAHLQEADLTRAHFQEANLTRARLQQANLREANFQGANLSAAHLQKTILLGANLQGAKLWGADLLEVKEWQGISDIRLANLYSLKTAPDGFVQWAVDNDAVCMADEKQWDKLRRNTNITREELRAAQKDCFPAKKESEASN